MFKVRAETLDCLRDHGSSTKTLQAEDAFGYGEVPMRRDGGHLSGGRRKP